MINDLERYALENNIPIIEATGKDFLINYLKENKVKTILEIGSAIGYSAIVMAQVANDIEVVTIERDEKRYLEACQNIEKFNLKKQITIYHADALEFTDNLFKNKFDLIFIDAAKAQYQKFFEKYEKHLTKDGSILVDNINFHGFVSGIRKTTNRNTRQLVGKIKRFNEWIIHNDNYQTTYYDVGDGIFVIKRKV